MKLRIEEPVIVITPTIGSQKLLKAIESIHNQTYKNIQHLIVVDGPEYYDDAVEVLGDMSNDMWKNVILMTNPFNTGRKNGVAYYGHRIYAGYMHLINSKYVSFLDEDNWFEPDHIETLVDAIQQDPDTYFSYSLRKIFDVDCNFLMEDNCESLGHLGPVWPSVSNIVESNVAPSFLVDTSSYLLDVEKCKEFTHLFHYSWGGDRKFYASMSRYRHRCNKKHTLCYRLDGNENSVTKDFFETGNAAYLKLYNNVLPWKDNK